MIVELTQSGSSAILTLNRPEALNALSFQILRDIGAALDSVALQCDVRVLLVVGAGDKAFCAGADIKELRHRRLIDQKRGAELGQAVFAKLDALPIPSIALVNGYAFGGGCGCGDCGFWFGWRGDAEAERGRELCDGDE